MQELDDLLETLDRASRRQITDRRTRWENAAARLSRLSPIRQFADRRDAAARLLTRAATRARHRLDLLHARFANVQGRLRLLDPAGVLARGYSITLDAATGAVVRDASTVQVGQSLRTRLKRGEVLSRAESQ